MAIFGDDRDSLRCSFCLKRRDEVTNLIAGPGGVYICVECVQLCNDIIGREAAAAASDQNPLQQRPKVVRLYVLQLFVERD